MYTELDFGKPISVSEIIIITSGMETLKYLFFKYAPLNSAIDARAVKLGGWGINLDRIPKSIKSIISISFLFNIVIGGKFIKKYRLQCDFKSFYRIKGY